MRTGGCVILAVAAFSVGAYVMDVKTETIPHDTVKVVHEPAKVLTHTVHDTVTVTKPLPDSCKTVIASLDRILASTSRVDTTATKYLQQLENIPVDLAGGATNNKLEIILSRIQSNMDDQLLPALDQQNDMGIYLQQCQRDSTD